MATPTSIAMQERRKMLADAGIKPVAINIPKQYHTAFKALSNVLAGQHLIDGVDEGDEGVIEMCLSSKLRIGDDMARILELKTKAKIQEAELDADKRPLSAFADKLVAVHAKVKQHNVDAGIAYSEGRMADHETGMAMEYALSYYLIGLVYALEAMFELGELPEWLEGL